MCVYLELKLLASDNWALKNLLGKPEQLYRTLHKVVVKCGVFEVRHPWLQPFLCYLLATSNRATQLGK